MAEMKFETLQFKDEKDKLLVILLKIFKFNILKKDLEAIGPFRLIDKHTIEFIDTFEHKARAKFGYLLEEGYKTLVNIVSKQPATYVHSKSGVPLIGNVAFGIVYRDYSLIEIKPVTSCNLSCVYCSVKEGKNSGKRDIVVQMEYILDELDKLLKFLGAEEKIEIHIGVQGAPFLYADLVSLIEELQKNTQIHTISMDTNYTLVTKVMVDRLVKCDKLRLNISLDAMDLTTARKIADTPNYNLNYVLDMIRYTAKTGLNYLVAPVFTPGFNMEELPKIIEFVKSLPRKSGSVPTLGIQNYLPYKAGRRPVREAMPWKEFYAMLKGLEEEYAVKLILDKEDFKIRATRELEKPFVIGDQITGVSVMPDRFPKTTLIRAKGRTISVPNTEFVLGKKIKVEITRDKHNIFVGKRI